MPEDHDHDYAAQHHRHYDYERESQELREDLDAAEGRIRELAHRLRDAVNRIQVLERDARQARQLQAELDATLADNAEAGHGD